MATWYTSEHEWIRVEGSTGVVGITKYAAEKLGDVVFVELPDVGRKVKKEGELAVVESVKAAADIFTPASGEVSEVNAALLGFLADVHGNSDAGSDHQPDNGGKR